MNAIISNAAAPNSSKLFHMTTNDLAAILAVHAKGLASNRFAELTGPVYDEGADMISIRGWFGSEEMDPHMIASRQTLDGKYVLNSGSGTVYAAGDTIDAVLAVLERAASGDRLDDLYEA